MASSSMTKGLIVTIGYLIMEAETITVTDSEGRTLPASIIGYDYESGFGLVRTEAPPPIKPMLFGDSDSLTLRGEAYVAGVGGEKATLKVKVAGRREFAGYWEYLLDNAIFTVPAYPLWGGSALVGMDGTLLGRRLAAGAGSAWSGVAGVPRQHVRADQSAEAGVRRAGRDRPAVDAAAAMARPLHGSSIWASSWSAASPRADRPTVPG